MPAFYEWKISKLANLCTNLKVKYFKKDQVVLKRYARVNYLLIVREGNLRVDMQIKFDQHNHWPSFERANKAKVIQRIPVLNSEDEDEEDVVV